jgi:hypothetical protein
VELIVSLVSTLGVTGVLVWYLYYNVSVSIPRLTDKHAETMDKITERFTGTLKEEREYRRTELLDLKTFIKSEACKHETK